MADVKKVATRVSYGEALVELGNERDDFVVLDADLAAATQTGKFKAAHPGRFYDAGIAESNLMGLAAGIATTGHVAFASTFAMFAAGRAYEQVRNSIGYPHLNVKIGATHAGISVGEDGATHQCCEDIALMRTIPGMTVVVPADDVEARACVRAAYEFEGPVYMRFGRLATPVINDHEDYEFKIGRGVVVREGSDVTIIACGLMVAEALEAAEALAVDGIDAEVINMHTIKPLDERLVVASAKKTGRVVTAEEHSIIGGLGEAVASVLAEQHPVPMRRVGVRDVYGESGPAVDLLHKYGLDADGIEAAVRSVLQGGFYMGFVSANQVTIGHASASREDALHYLSEQAVELGFADDASAVEAAFIARENEAETGLVAGFAVPHAKSDAIHTPGVAVLKLAEPVEWPSFDGVPVDVALALYVPAGEAGTTHLRLLSKAAVMLMDAGFRDKVRASTDPVEIAELINSGLED